MKKLVGLILALIGGGVSLWAAALLIGGEAGGRMYGYDPVYGGLAGLAVLTVGMLWANSG